MSGSSIIGRPSLLLLQKEPTAFASELKAKIKTTKLQKKPVNLPNFILRVYQMLLF